jgi:Protein of unknown function (DUF1488)
MPLTRVAKQPILKMSSIRFLMKDGEWELICSISNRTLMAFGARWGMQDAQMVFWAYQDEIERAASDKYDRTGRKDYAILHIDEDDL